MINRVCFSLYYWGNNRCNFSKFSPWYYLTWYILCCGPLSLCLSIGAVFAIFAGASHWFPIIFGLSINNTLLKLHFFIIFIGVNITFFPQHFLGLNGIPRRYSDYPDYFTCWNTISTFGSIISVLGIVLYIFIIWEALISKRIIINSHYVNSSIEWQINFPPSEHTFNQSNILIK